MTNKIGQKTDRADNRAASKKLQLSVPLRGIIRIVY